MVKVIGAGFPRTGTSSMKAALERLGFGPVYHMFDVLTRTGHVERWLPVTDGKTLNWPEVLQGYESTQDWPASHFWREQAEAYPEAKVVLTVRDPHRWYASMQVLISEGPGRELPAELPEQAAAFFGAMARFGPVLNHIGRSAFGAGWHFNGGMPDDAVAVAAFHRHLQAVRSTIPADRLLIFDVREGWEPLCRFLGVEVPDEPFPHLNESGCRATLKMGM
ncbi:sulfotransferase family protein [Nonomuraea sp. B5E05]|uniref:sulfotransferase family protein n=1 Tax=Nonomuraea sp. B5E05 TaxID=3153569 RepID=UPI00325FFFA0